MDPKRFDRWTRSLHSRRAVVPALVGLGAGLGLAHPSAAAPIPAKKHKRPSFGCTKQANVCTATMGFPCPEEPAGTDGSCAVDTKGKPFCAIGGACAPCTKNRDCAAAFPGAICVKCPVCEQSAGVKSACLVPLTDH
jgi:hypothetical protein